jgi:hypothetical protein
MNAALLKMYIEQVRQHGCQHSEDMYEAGYLSGIMTAATDILKFIEEMEE